MQIRLKIEEFLFKLKQTSRIKLLVFSFFGLIVLIIIVEIGYFSILIRDKKENQRKNLPVEPRISREKKIISLDGPLTVYEDYQGELNMARGEVVEKKDHELVLERDGDRLTVALIDKPLVYLSEFEGDELFPTKNLKETDISSIKVGDKVYIHIFKQIEGKYYGSVVFISN